MRYEVEQKHRVDDEAALIAKLAERGVTLAAAIDQSDQYFAHPSRDFARTDEALRIRTSGGAAYVTYKGPKVDATTKTRRELELPLHPSDVDGAKFAEVLRMLSFTPVATVHKRRRVFHVDFKGQSVEGALDEADGLGTFIELELVSDEAELSNARELIHELADELELGSSERRSYLELLLAKKLGR